MKYLICDIVGVLVFWEQTDGVCDSGRAEEDHERHLVVEEMGHPAHNKQFGDGGEHVSLRQAVRKGDGKGEHLHIHADKNGDIIQQKQRKKHDCRKPQGRREARHYIGESRLTD